MTNKTIAFVITALLNITLNSAVSVAATKTTSSLKTTASEAKTCKDNGGDVTSSISKVRTEVCVLVNRHRIARGQNALKLDPKMSWAAQGHAEDMAANDYFSHTSLDGASPFDRMEEMGVDSGSAAENIASGQKGSQKVMTAWLNSKGHHKNIDGNPYTRIGVGFYDGKWVQVFAD